MKILLLEDDYALNTAIKQSIEMGGFCVDTFYDGMHAYEAVVDLYDLFILDINTPGLDGLALLGRIRGISPRAHVLIISANIDISSLKEAYARGCDDYLKKPFEVDELLFKIQRIAAQENIALYSNCHYNHTTKKIYKDNKALYLTHKEGLLFDLLLKHRGDVVTKEQIVEFVYKQEVPLDATIRSLLRRLRERFSENIIQNINGRGYILVENTNL
ncbi:MAG: response regulator transcription factor [Campylobacterales bacterium]|nr:response regulator transcription factor [Campylobacterales bacterium]